MAGRSSSGKEPLPLLTVRVLLLAGLTGLRVANRVESNAEQREAKKLKAPGKRCRKSKP